MSHVLLIHGAWGGAWEFEGIVSDLNKRGHRASAIDLPGHGDAPAPIPAVNVRAYVDRVVQEVEASSERVVLVGHSLGGSIISQVAERVPEKIERLVYVCAILPAHGETPIGLMQSDKNGQLLPRIVFSDDQSYVTLGEQDVRDVLLHDVREPRRVDELVPHFMMKQATEPFMAPAELTDNAFGSVSKAYIRCTLDKVLTPELQDRMIAASNVDQVITLESGHFPLMSVPDLLVDGIALAVSPLTSTA